MKTVFENLEAEVDQNAIDLKSEVRAMKTVFENLEAEVDQNAIDLKSGKIKRKNLLITNENLIANCIAHDVFFSVTDSAITTSRFHELSTAYTVAMNRDTTSLQNEIENLKTQLKGKMPCVTSNDATSKAPTCAKYAIDVQPIPPHQRNNKVVHHGYLNRLRDTLDTLCKIVKEARSKRLSDNNLDYACVYTKRSQELLENMSASCPKVDNKRDIIIATTHVTRKKNVTFADPLETSGNNLSKIVKQQIV
nr:hypothetical protein [Tanacetum cinerariifolium]